MHSPDNIQYALETTRVLLEPDRRIDTFGDTRFEFLLLSELMDRAGEVRVRTGEMEAMRPRILRPDSMNDIELEGFGDKARERMDALIEKMQSQGKDLAFLRYGFRFRSGKVHEEIVHDSMDVVRDRILEESRRLGNPARAVIEGVDDAWEVSVFKFAFEMIRQSWAINRFDFHRRGLL
ncbi:hypothetical protein [Luteolibacter luteus]|uniref:Uncharacterized protein n=1 Tax=Luteolibacter luteus TaxID=2728835 RepID=A0A858RE28_9BACT|nr:hypothetical protein [Luteolibacter luteus]QJE94570.1 hypothetical protein HHL09_01815 [Luteolibacter luteus]